MVEPDDGLDITGLLTEPSGLHAPSPHLDNTSLLFGDAATPAGDSAMDG